MQYLVITKRTQIWENNIEASSYEEAVEIANQSDADAGTLCAEQQEPIEIQLGDEEPRKIINGKLS
jgi:hypothetical protein